MAEQFRQINRSLAEQFRQIKRNLGELFSQIKYSLAEPHVEISFWFGKGDIPNEKIAKLRRSCDSQCSAKLCIIWRNCSAK